MLEEYLILGLVQGVVEWLPVSSEGVLVLIQLGLWGDGQLIGEMVRLALFLHAGSLLAVGVYFRRDLGRLLRLIWNYRAASLTERSLFRFLVISSAVTAVIGGVIYLLLERLGEISAWAGAGLMLAIGAALLVTAYLQFRARLAPPATRELKQFDLRDGLILGLVQALAVLPGLSRSGSTVSVLLLRRVRDTDALKASFLMSLPVVLGGNLLLNLGDFTTPTAASVAGLLAAFAAGLATIHLLMKIAERVPFVWFTAGFGFLTLAAGLIVLLLQ